MAKTQYCDFLKIIAQCEVTQKCEKHVLEAEMKTSNDQNNQLLVKTNL